MIKREGPYVFPVSRVFITRVGKKETKMATSPSPGGTLKRDKGWMGTLTRRSRKAEKEGN